MVFDEDASQKIFKNNFYIYTSVYLEPVLYKKKPPEERMASWVGETVF